MSCQLQCITHLFHAHPFYLRKKDSFPPNKLFDMPTLVFARDRTSVKCIQPYSPHVAVHFVVYIESSQSLDRIQ